MLESSRSPHVGASRISPVSPFLRHRGELLGRSVLHNVEYTTCLEQSDEVMSDFLQRAVAGGLTQRRDDRARSLITYAVNENRYGRSRLLSVAQFEQSKIIRKPVRTSARLPIHLLEQPRLKNERLHTSGNKAASMSPTGPITTRYTTEVLLR